MIAVEKQGAVCVIRPEAPLAKDQAAKLRGAALGALGAGRPMVVVDLQAAPHMDGAGLEALIDLAEHIESRGGALKLAAVNPLCSDILRVTGVGERFDQYLQVKAAVGSFAE